MTLTEKGEIIWSQESSIVTSATLENNAENRISAVHSIDPSERETFYAGFRMPYRAKLEFGIVDHQTQGRNGLTYILDPGKAFKKFS